MRHAWIARGMCFNFSHRCGSELPVSSTGHAAELVFKHIVFHGLDFDLFSSHRMGVGHFHNPGHGTLTYSNLMVSDFYIFRP